MSRTAFGLLACFCLLLSFVIGLADVPCDDNEQRELAKDPQQWDFTIEPYPMGPFSHEIRLRLTDFPLDHGAAWVFKTLTLAKFNPIVQLPNIDQVVFNKIYLRLETLYKASEGSDVEKLHTDFVQIDAGFTTVGQLELDFALTFPSPAATNILVAYCVDLVIPVARIPGLRVAFEMEAADKTVYFMPEIDVPLQPESTSTPPVHQYTKITEDESERGWTIDFTFKRPNSDLVADAKIFNFSANATLIHDHRFFNALLDMGNLVCTFTPHNENLNPFNGVVDYQKQPGPYFGSLRITLAGTDKMLYDTPLTFNCPKWVVNIGEIPTETQTYHRSYPITWSFAAILDSVFTTMENPITYPIATWETPAFNPPPPPEPTTVDWPFTLEVSPFGDFSPSITLSIDNFPIDNGFGFDAILKWTEGPQFNPKQTPYVDAVTWNHKTHTETNYKFDPDLEHRTATFPLTFVRLESPTRFKVVFHFFLLEVGDSFSLESFQIVPKETKNTFVLPKDQSKVFPIAKTIADSVGMTLQRAEKEKDQDAKNLRTFSLSFDKTAVPILTGSSMQLFSNFTGLYSGSAWFEHIIDAHNGNGAEREACTFSKDFGTVRAVPDTLLIQLAFFFTLKEPIPVGSSFDIVCSGWGVRASDEVTRTSPISYQLSYEVGTDGELSHHVVRDDDVENDHDVITATTTHISTFVSKPISAQDDGHGDDGTSNHNARNAIIVIILVLSAVAVIFGVVYFLRMKKKARSNQYETNLLTNGDDDSYPVV